MAEQQPPVAADHANGSDELRLLARELLDAEAAYRQAPTFANGQQLARLRRRLEEVLTERP